MRTVSVNSQVISCWCKHNYLHTNICQSDLYSNHCIVGGKYFNSTSQKLCLNESPVSNPSGTDIFNYDITKVMESFGVFYMINSCLCVYADSISASGQTASRWRMTQVSTLGEGGGLRRRRREGQTKHAHIHTVGLVMECLGIACTVFLVLCCFAFAVWCSKVGGAKGAEVLALDAWWIW